MPTIDKNPLNEGLQRAFHIIRFIPCLARGESINIAVVLRQPSGNRVRQTRFLTKMGEVGYSGDWEAIDELFLSMSEAIRMSELTDSEVARLNAQFPPYQLSGQLLQALSHEMAPDDLLLLLLQEHVTPLGCTERERPRPPVPAMTLPKRPDIVPDVERPFLDVPVRLLARLMTAAASADPEGVALAEGFLRNYKMNVDQKGHASVAFTKDARDQYAFNPALYDLAVARGKVETYAAAALEQIESTQAKLSRVASCETTYLAALSEQVERHEGLSRLVEDQPLSASYDALRELFAGMPALMASTDDSA